MTDKNKVKRLQAEIKRAVKWINVIKDNALRNRLKAYIIGIQFAIDIIIGGNGKSILDGLEERTKENN